MVVASAVDKHEMDVPQEIIDALVVIEVIARQLLLYRAEVHRVRDDLVIVWHLQTAKDIVMIL